MTADEYREDRELTYETKLLKDLRAAVRSIDSKVEEILDELKEHFPSRGGNGDEWHADDLYDGNSYGAY